MICTNILEAIGNTPIIQLNKIVGEDSARILVKFEGLNVGGSIKTRTAYNMIKDAQNKGLINKDTIIVEPTSGNQGIGLALVGAVKGYKVKIIMPDSVSVERRKLINHYGAEVILVHDAGNIGEAIAECLRTAERMAAEDKNVFIPWGAFVHANGNVGITDPSKINKFGFGFDLSSSTAYTLAFTISDMGTYKSKNTVTENKNINISGIENGGEYRQKDARAEITTYDPANTEIYVNYEKVDCVADGNGAFVLSFSKYEPGDYNLIVAVNDKFNKKNYKQVKFTVLKDYIYWK